MSSSGGKKSSTPMRSAEALVVAVVMIFGSEGSELVITKEFVCSHISPSSIAYALDASCRCLKSKRKQLAAQGLHNLRAEPGRFVGFHGPYSSTYAVMLDPQRYGQQDRLVHSINVTFDDDDYIVGAPPGRAATPAAYDTVPQPGAQAEEAQRGPSNPPLQAIDNRCRNRLCALNRYHQCQTSRTVHYIVSQAQQRHRHQEYFDLDDPNTQTWFTHEGSPQPRPRPTYTYAIRKQAMCNMIMSDCNSTDADYAECMHILTTLQPRYSTYTEMSCVLAAHSQKDMDWKLALQGPDRDRVITALESELSSLQDTILTRVT